MSRFTFSLDDFGKNITPLASHHAGFWASNTDNIFIRFLTSMSAEATKELTYLRFLAADCDALATHLPLIASLVEAYLPGLNSLEFCVSEATVDWNDSPDYWHPDPSSPFWMNGEFWPMYKALDDLVDKIGWLTHLGYSGQENFGSVDNEKLNGSDLLTRLEKRVQERKGMGVSWKGIQPQTIIAWEAHRDDEGSRPAICATTDEDKGTKIEVEGREGEIDDLLEIMGAGDMV